MFKRIVFAAAFAGLIAGLLLTAIQQFEVTPLIRAAESFEATRGAAPPAILATAAANVVLATAFALLLSAALALRDINDWRTGLLWGAAGYAVFFVAPSLGLTPEVPGTDSAALHERQLWWIGTALCSAAGLWLVAFAGKRVLRVTGALLLIAPHALGAPQPAIHAAAAPVELADAFVRATYVANAIFWLALGGLVGFFRRRRPVTLD